MTNSPGRKMTNTRRRVLNIFGRVIRPANWFIFTSGIVLMIIAPIVFAVANLDPLGSAILFIQGVQLAVEGYGEIKEDEDV